MNPYLKNTAIIALIAGFFTACNKDIETTKAVAFDIVGYNTSNNDLEISVDTVVFSRFPIAANSVVSFGKSYTYPSVKREAQISVKDKQSGNEVWKQTVRLSDAELEQFYPFVWLDGQVLAVNPPTADANTNKIGFYVHYPQSNDPIDIFIKNEAGQAAYFAKNVTPGTWVYSDYVTPEGFFQNPNGDFYIHCTKAGTTDSWAFDNNEAKSKVSNNNNGTFFPLHHTQKGNVRSYFITPGMYQMELIRLFKKPRN
ncbi:hypothetical protein [uncultured Chitinophaga sp.]|uniref:hypothetical protein n=1 Tax=uncultured Chitinophaga sp. TaxID=339340 RepID=UPI0025E44B42|nr:hypothetical protein [uncultured Chitinophaga sp.]